MTLLEHSLRLFYYYYNSNNLKRHPCWDGVIGTGWKNVLESRAYLIKLIIQLNFLDIDKIKYLAWDKPLKANTGTKVSWLIISTTLIKVNYSNKIDRITHN